MISASPLARLIVISATALLLLGSQTAQAADRIRITPGPDSYVYAISNPDANGTRYIGGDFDWFNQWDTGSGTLVDGNGGSINPSFPKVVGTVNAVAADGTGGFYIGGSITRVDGVARSKVAHLNADGSLDLAWNPVLNGAVNAIAVSGSTVYLGGLFTTLTQNSGSSQGGCASGSPCTRSKAAAVDAATGYPTAWNPNIDGWFGGAQVNAIAIAGTVVYLAGFFQSVGGAALDTFGSLAAVDGTTGTAYAWRPKTSGSSSRVNAIAVSGSTVYIGGAFTQVDGQARNRLAAMQAGSCLDSYTAACLNSAWNPGANDSIKALAVAGSAVYVGGAFTQLGGQPRNRAAAVDATTGAVASWNPNPNATVETLAASGATVYLGGSFGSVGGQNRLGAAAVDVGTGTLTAWSPTPHGSVYAIAAAPDRVYLGGQFQQAGGQPRNRVAAVDASGALTSWNPGVNGTVYAIRTAGSAVYLGGTFSSVGGQPRTNAAAVDTSGALTNWNPSADGIVNGIATDGSNAYLVGGFTQVGGQPRNRAAAVDATTGALTAWNPNLNGVATAIAISGSTAFIAGTFTQIGAQSRTYAGAVDLTTGAPTSWQPAVDNRVDALAVAGGTVYLGGYFTNLGGQPRSYAGAVDASTGTVKAWNPSPDANVTSIATRGSTVFLGGSFTNAGGQPRAYIAAVDGTSGTSTAWNPRLDGYQVNTISSGGTMLIGGDFTSADGGATPASNLLAIPSGPPDAPAAPTATAGNAQAVIAVGPGSGTGGTPVITTVTAANDPTKACSVEGASGTCTITGLANGTRYTFTATATNSLGTSAVSVESNAITPAAPASGGTAAAASPAPTGTPKPHTAARDDAPAEIVLPAAAHRNGLAVGADATIALTLSCPAGGADCRMSGTISLPTGRARRATPRAAALGSFENVTVKAGTTRAITVQLRPSAITRLAGPTTRRITARVTLRTARAGTAPTIGRFALRLRIPRQTDSTEPVTG